MHTQNFLFLNIKQISKPRSQKDNFKDHSPVLCCVLGWTELRKTVNKLVVRIFCQIQLMINQGMYFGKPVSKSWVTLQMKIHLNISIISAASRPEEQPPHSSAAGIPVASSMEGLLQVTTERHWKNKEKNSWILLGSTFLLPWYWWCFSKWPHYILHNISIILYLIPVNALQNSFVSYSFT